MNQNSRYIAIGAAVAAVVAVAAILIVIAVTGGDDSEGVIGEFTQTLPTRPSGNVTPFPTPQVTGDEILSPTKGYSATKPAGWNLRPNLVQTADASLDAIFEPLPEGANVQANIVINCIVRKAADPQARIDTYATTLARVQLNQDIQVSQTTIAGVQATVLTYLNTSQAEDDSPDLDKTDYLFTNEKCDWIITTTTRAGDRATYQPIFDAFLASFELI